MYFMVIYFQIHYKGDKVMNNFKEDLFYRFIKTKKQPRGVMIITHGLRANGSAHCCLVKFLLKKGYHVMIWDLPSHGRSGGEPGFIDNFTDCVRGMLFIIAQTLREERKLPIYMIAHSTGFSVTTLALSWLKNSEKTRILSRIYGIIAVDPAFHVLHNVNRVLQMLAPIAPLLLKSKWISRVSVGGWDPNCITDDEKVIRWMEKNRYFYRGQLFLVSAYEIFVAGEVYPGLKHNPLDGKRTSGVRKDILQWMEEQSPQG
jgi:alpha-beta hydrolase superfamily lysophospholipase